ncbi:hypothetical protein [Nonomuraea rhodomycinica]|uniref:Uncharacterized protein n=1 Tax=Nonomuraea rhodomycinica TaxID=1712872 RepID=A0A7Y6INY9_9ACTN|nr:hypothetical protein [Nonomuraea rhodomycinica]NUW41625.1 hypothetical protein [Nonomuraea rhodomycinica]
MDLDEVADRLYGLPPSEFTAAREAEARAAKDAGDATLSREIGRLRKPTVSAWAVNRAVREHPDELRELLEVGEELRRAWAAHDAEALAGVARRRGAVAERVGRLVKEDVALSAAAAVEVDRTLDAAVVDEGAAAEVRRGHLVRPLEYSGFAPAPAPTSAPSPSPPSASGAEPRTGEGSRAAPARTARRAGAPAEEPGGRAARKAAEEPGGRAARKAAAEERARREAEARAAREARRAQERVDAEAAYLEWREALTEAVREHDKRAEKVARLERKLTKARAKLRESEQRLEVARREERHARHRLEG